MNLAELAPRFQGVRWSGEDRFAARCPAHDDHNPSLSVRRGEKGIVFKCFKECKQENILAAANLTWADVFNGNGHAPALNVVKTYPYRDETGTELFKTNRTRDKKFFATKPDGTRGIEGIRRVPYMLPELLKADPETDVFICEGEKDCDTLRDHGLTATTNPFGAGNWRDEFNHFFKDRHVVILPDYDTPGQAHGQKVAAALTGIAASVKVVNLFDGPIPKEHGRDVSDYLQDHDVEELVRRVEAASPWTPVTLTSDPNSCSAPAPEKPGSSLVRLDVSGLLARGGWEPQPVLDDFLWNKTFTYLSGSSGSFKTWLMLTWAVGLVMNKPFIRQNVHGEHRILFVECESSVQILQRLPKVCAAYGCTVQEVLEKVLFVIPEGKALRLENPPESRHVLQLADDWGASWVFTDSLRRVTSLDENKADEMSMLADTAFLPLRDAGHNVLLLEHPTKPMSGVTRNRREMMRGSGDKAAAADVVLHVDSLETETGRVAALSVAKCRFAPERDEPLFMQLRSEGAGLEFQEVEQPQEAKAGRKPKAIEQARNVILAERGRNASLTYSDAIRSCRAAGVSESTAKRAWSEVQGSEGSKLGSEPGTGSKVQKVHTPVGGEP
jgi:5S rRNA maturation endonuclease (ribonuclease M5)